MRAWRVGTLGAVLLLIPIGGCSGGDSEADPDASAASLATGECLNVVDGSDGDAASLSKVPCDQPHAGEVVLSAANFFAEDSELPSGDRLQSIADTACEDAMVSYSGQSSTQAGARMSYAYPSAETWEDGDRALTCIAVTLDPETGEITAAEGSLAAT
jgi:hypothetical protein